MHTLPVTTHIPGSERGHANVAHHHSRRCGCECGEGGSSHGRPGPAHRLPSPRRPFLPLQMRGCSSLAVSGLAARSSHLWHFATPDAQLHPQTKYTRVSGRDTSIGIFQNKKPKSQKSPQGQPKLNWMIPEVPPSFRSNPRICDAGKPGGQWFPNCWHLGMTQSFQTPVPLPHTPGCDELVKSRARLWKVLNAQVTLT